MAAASTPRRSTPARRARSSSVASNTSRASSRAPTSARKSTATSTPKKESTAAASATPSKKGSAKKASAAASKASATDRPALPSKKNPKLPGEPVQVKLQTIKREDMSIIIGRVKLETVNGADHGFLLKRFDTDAVAASSMFRLAFPYADGEAERLEMAYLDRNFDTDRANGGMVSKPKRGRPKKGAAEDDKSTKALPEGSTGVRLQGTWLPCEDALDIAEEYGLALYAKPLIEAKATTVDGVAHLVSSGDAPATPAKAASKAGDASDGTPASNRKRQRTSKAAADATPSKADAAASPKTSAARSRSKKATKGDTEETTHTKTTTSIEAAPGMTQAQIDEQIKMSRALAKEVQSSSSGKTTAASRKRRASNDRPTADLDVLADDSSASNFVSRPLRRAGRTVRRRPVATAAGTVGAVAAAGVGALAWFAGGNLDVAQQILQQGFVHLQGFFF